MVGVSPVYVEMWNGTFCGKLDAEKRFHEGKSQQERFPCGLEELVRNSWSGVKSQPEDTSVFKHVIYIGGGTLIVIVHEYKM